MSEVSASTVEGFLDSLASGSSTPGGGAAAALTAALGAAIIEMACSFAIGKKNFAGSEEQLQRTSRRCKDIRARATILADLDGDAYGKVMSAFDLPKDSSEQRASRKRAISTAAEAATLVPLELAQLCEELVRLGSVAAEVGNPNLIGDAAGGAALARGAARVCELNVKANLGFVDDVEFIASARKRLAEAGGALESGDALVEKHL